MLNTVQTYTEVEIKLISLDRFYKYCSTWFFLGATALISLQGT